MVKKILLHSRVQFVLLIVCFYELIARNIFKRLDRESEVVFLFWPVTVRQYFDYFSRAYFLQDVTLIFALLKSHETLRVIRPRDLRSIAPKQIVYHSLNPFQKNKSESFKSQGELLFDYMKKFNIEFRPSANEARLWENKLFMHEEFARLNIEQPSTQIVRNMEDINKLSLNFPLLCKIPNGNHSRGIDWHNDFKSLKLDAVSKLTYNEGVIIQEVIPSQFDIRVVTVGDKVEYFYWRFKEVSDRFTTTSTSNGSVLNQDPLPIEVINTCLSTSKKLNLSLAAYDVTFIKSDSIIKPVIYEVSSSFLLNPIPPIEYSSKPYLKYKSKIWNFTFERLKQFTVLKSKLIESYCNEKI
tara:strand:- start:21 stop:1085 length:1065 start_codon:yes stop_codon:yes gene_type:complete